ncbi:helix-turn-helix domain-containing protein [Lactonifactor longoviformis]|uniref:helix-turn-helix domain-containing protein n=1 Tax=Lactonifactor longoviformis TaxID=341220 RepID=UPI0036F3FEFD
MDVTKIVAANVKDIREKKKLTLDAAAETTGVSRSMLAQIEKGDVNPTISVLWKIANGYKVSFTSLVEGPEEPAVMIKRMAAEPLAEDDGRYLNYPVFGFDEQKLFESYRIVIKPGGRLSAQPHMTGAEEYITVFYGKVIISVEEETYHLEQGDSIRFLADVSHSYENVGEEEAGLSMLIYYNK